MKRLLLALLFSLGGCSKAPQPLHNDPAPAPATQVSAPPAGMVLIPAGSFLMGEDDPAHDYNGPVHQVTVKSFWMDATEVTNAQFTAFVEATHYITQAERTPRAEEFPDADPALLKPGANHFVGTTHSVEQFTGEAEFQWWEYKIGADWRHPDGPQSEITQRADYPVCCISWDDADAYTKWANKRLPTEAEWEYAARGGLASQPYVWGKELKPGGKWMCNIWQGEFPNADSAEDGYHGLAPVRSFPANGYGLYEISGNVWEWINDWFAPDYYLRSPASNPPGSSPVPDYQRGAGAPCKVIRGGSWLCNDCYCGGYRPAARQWTTRDTSSNHTGFRCVRDL